MKMLLNKKLGSLQINKKGKTALKRKISYKKINEELKSLHKCQWLYIAEIFIGVVTDIKIMIMF